MIGTLLLDTLWQGALVVLVGAALVAFIPQRNAATRYAVWFVVLLALGMVPLATLWQPLGSPPSSLIHATSAASRVTQRAAHASGWYLTIAWLAGAAFCLGRLALSYLRIVRIVRRSSPAAQFGSGVATSSDLSVPIAAGFFKPIVVLPAAVATTFERVDIDSIVRHERAHIRRLDIAGNFVQRIIEALLFFTPWVYVIGRQLVKEREAACDDWAMSGPIAPDRYASCLARLAEIRPRRQGPLLTPSAIGPRNILVGRIARILNGKAAQLKTNYLFVGAATAAFALLAFALQLHNAAAVASTANPTLPATCYHGVRIANAIAPDIGKSDYRPNAVANALVTVDAQGRPVSAKIVRSSGSPVIDRATVQAAMRSSYDPEVSDCKPKTGQYLFHVETGPSEG